MSIIIDTYKPHYLKIQAELGKKIWELHSYGFYSSLEQLETSYSGDSFDPELKLYAFDGEEMVGFVTATLLPDDSADIAFPHVIGLDQTITDQLYYAILEKLRFKGVKHITARAGNGRRNTLELIKRYGFSHVRDQVHLTWFTLDEINLETYPILKNIADFNYDKDLEVVAQFFSDQFSMDIEQARSNFQSIKEMDQSMLLAHVIASHDGNIVGRGFMQQLSQKDKLNRIARLSPIIAIGENQDHTTKIRLGIFRHMMEVCKTLGMYHINMPFVGVSLEKTRPYTFLNKEFYTIGIYEKYFDS